MRFFIKIYRHGGNYSALAPDLPGCVAAAATVEEIRELMAEAITMHLELMQDSGEKIPTPRQTIRFSIGDSSEEELCTWVQVTAPKRRSKRVGAH